MGATLVLAACRKRPNTIPKKVAKSQTTCTQYSSWMPSIPDGILYKSQIISTPSRRRCMQLHIQLTPRWTVGSVVFEAQGPRSKVLHLGVYTVLPFYPIYWDCTVLCALMSIKQRTVTTMTCLYKMIRNDHMALPMLHFVEVKYSPSHLYNNECQRRKDATTTT